MNANWFLNNLPHFFVTLAAQENPLYLSLLLQNKMMEVESLLTANRVDLFSHQASSCPQDTGRRDTQTLIFHSLAWVQSYCVNRTSVCLERWEEVICISSNQLSLWHIQLMPIHSLNHSLPPISILSWKSFLKLPQGKASLLFSINAPTFPDY